MGNRFCLLRGREPVPERLTRPQRLVWQTSHADYRKLRRLILARKLAPCYDAFDDPDADLEECPICFFYFPSLNRSRCCSKGICTECFLQTKPLDRITCSAQCPFCKSFLYTVKYHGARTKEEKLLEHMEEQKVIEAQIRMQHQDQFLSDHITPSSGAHLPLELHKTTAAVAAAVTPTPPPTSTTTEPLPARSSSSTSELHIPIKSYAPPNVISKDFEIALAEEQQRDHNSYVITGIPRELDLYAEPGMFVLMEHIRHFLDILNLVLFYVYLCSHLFHACNM